MAPAELVGLAGRAGAETTPRPRPAFLMRMFRPFTPSALPPVPPPASLGLSIWLPALHQWADTTADTRSSAQVPVESKRSQQVHLAFGGPYSPLRWTWRCRVHLAAGASAFHSHARASAPAPAAGAPAACRSCRGQGQATWGLRQGHVTRRAPAERRSGYLKANCHFGIFPQHLCVELQDAALSPRAKMFTEEDVLDLASEGRMRCHHVNESVPRHDRVHRMA